MAQDGERDFLDEMVETIADGNRADLDEWETTKLVALIAKARRDRGLTQAQVAERMALPSSTSRAWRIAPGARASEG